MRNGHAGRLVFQPSCANGSARGILFSDPFRRDLIPQMSKTLSTIITNRVKGLGYKRYKLVAVVTVGQLADQGIRVVRVCPWNYGPSLDFLPSLLPCAWFDAPREVAVSWIRIGTPLLRALIRIHRYLRWHLCTASTMTRHKGQSRNCPIS